MAVGEDIKMDQSTTKDGDDIVTTGEIVKRVHIHGLSKDIQVITEGSDSRVDKPKASSARLATRKDAPYSEVTWERFVEEGSGLRRGGPEEGDLGRTAA